MSENKCSMSAKFRSNNALFASRGGLVFGEQVRHELNLTDGAPPFSLLSIAGLSLVRRAKPLPKSRRRSVRVLATAYPMPFSHSPTLGRPTV